MVKAKNGKRTRKYWKNWKVEEEDVKCCATERRFISMSHE